MTARARVRQTGTAISGGPAVIVVVDPLQPLVPVAAQRIVRRELPVTCQVARQLSVGDLRDQDGAGRCADVRRQTAYHGGSVVFGPWSVVYQLWSVGWI